MNQFRVSSFEFRVKRGHPRVSSFAFRRAGVEFDNDDGDGEVLALYADEGGAGDGWVGVEDGFDGGGEEGGCGAVGGGCELDALGFSADEPEAVLGVEVAAVAHAVGDGVLSAED